jgi:WD40 repeat protein
VELFGLSGGWPLPLVLAGRAFGMLYGLGRREAGATARSVQAAGGDVVAAVLDLLPPTDRERCLMLAIFPAEQAVPLGVLQRLWACSRAAVRRTRAELVQALLVVEPGPDALGLPVAVSALLRRVAGPDGLRALHGGLLDAVPAPAGGAWWTMPDDPSYLVDNLAAHLAGAGRTAELATLVGDLRWVHRRLRDGGACAVAADLAAARSPAAAVLARVVRQDERLLARVEPVQALGAALAGRLDGVGELRPAVAAFRAGLPTPYLAHRWPPPDRQPARRRRIAVGVEGNAGLYLAVGPDGSWLAVSGDTINTTDVEVHDPATGEFRASLRRSGSVSAILASPDGSWLATVSGGLGPGGVRLWSAATGELLHLLPGETSELAVAAVAPDGRWLAIGGEDGTVRICEAGSGALRRAIVTGAGATRALAVAPDGSWLAGLGEDGSVQVWDPHTGAHRHTWTGVGTPGADWRVPATLTVAPDGSWLAAGAGDGSVRVLDPVSGRQRYTLGGDGTQVRDLLVAPDGSWLAAGGAGGTVRVWDTATGDLRHALAVHPHGVCGLAVAPDGQWLAAASGGDGMVRIWDAGTGRLRTTLPTGEDGVCSLAVAPDGSWLATGGNSVAGIWDPAVPAPPGAEPGHTVGVSGIAAAADGSWLATADRDCSVRIWQPRTGAQQHLLPGEFCGGGPIAAPAHDRTWLACGTGTGLVRIWEPLSGRLRHAIAAHDSLVQDMVAGPDGSWLATAGWDRTTRIWDPVTGEQRHAVPVGDHIGCFVVAPGWLATLPSPLGGAVQVWDPTTGTLQHTLQQTLQRSGGSGPAAAAPDGSWLATCGPGIRIWDLPAGTERLAVTGRDRPATVAMAASPDGAWLAAVGYHSGSTRLPNRSSGEIRIYDAASGHSAAVMPVPAQLTVCRWAQTGTTLYAGGPGGCYAFDWVMDSPSSHGYDLSAVGRW